MPRIVDLSKPVRYDKRDPWFMRVKLTKMGHKFGRMAIRLYFRLPFNLFPKGFVGWADDTIKMGVHSTTHLDAPWHYGPVSGGAPAKTIDQVPLEWCFGPGVVIDVTQVPDFEQITVKDLTSNLLKTGAVIKPGTIVFIRTGRDKFMGTPEYTEKGTGMSREATKWIVDQGVHIIGIDQWGFDLPLKWMAKEARRRKDPEFFWQAHLVGAEKEYCHIEQMVNLGALPPHGFQAAVFPLRIEGASASPVRVVAIFEEGK